MIKRYKKALHKLRVVIRGYRKRKKEEKTFNPDLEMKNFFQKWVIETFPQGLEEFRNKNNNDEKNDNIIDKNKVNKPRKSKKKIKDKENLESMKLNKLKHIIKLIIKKKKKLKTKYHENENSNNIDIKIYFDRWRNIINNIKNKETKNINFENHINKDIINIDKNQNLNIETNITKEIIRDPKEKEIVAYKDKSREKNKDITKKIIKEFNMDRMKIKDKNKKLEIYIEKNKNKSLDIIKDLEKRKKNKEEFIYKNSKKAHLSYQSDIMNVSKKSNQPKIESYELPKNVFEEKINKDDIKFGINKSQENKFEGRAKKARTHSKKDKCQENEEEFYFIKIVQRKKNDVKKKLFDKLSSQLEKNIDANNSDENKEEKNDISENNNNKNEKENFERKNEVKKSNRRKRSSTVVV